MGGVGARFGHKKISSPDTNRADSSVGFRHTLCDPPDDSGSSKLGVQLA